VDALVTRLGLIEQQLNLQHRRDLEALQSSNRTVLIVAGIFAGVGFLGILFAVLILLRTMNRLSEVALTYSVGQGLVASHAPPVLVPGESPSAGTNPVEQVSARFLGAIERLEKRIGELEHSAQSVPVPPGTHYALDSAKSFEVRPGAEGDATPGVAANMQPNKRSSGPADHPPPTAMAASNGETASQVALMVGKGQALLNLGQAEDALVCLEKAIGFDPANADALIKRGMALERLQRTDEALASYDQAIAAKGEMTLAYLHKGAIYNRQQRFREALECYEKALKTEQKPSGS
jgi:tetratricopeptide (TPR) repeat protein